MSQKRIQDFGSTVIARSLKLLSGSLVTSAILEGNEFLVDASDRLRINPGTSITHQGVIIIEDEPKYLIVPNTSNPVDYTVYYQHEDADISGGVPANLIIDTGILTAAVIEGVILGYVRYPGGSVPLSASHFFQPLPTTIGVLQPTRENADWVVPNNNYLITQSSGSLNLTTTWDTSGPTPQMYLRIRNNSLATASVTITFPFKVKENPFGLCQLVMGADINATLNPFLIDNDGVVHNLTISPLTGIPNLALQSFDIPKIAVQEPNTLVYLQLFVQCSINREVRVQALGLSEYNLPV